LALAWHIRTPSAAIQPNSQNEQRSDPLTAGAPPFEIIDERTRKILLKFPMPLFVVIAYLFMGFWFEWWHPGWMIFFSIPVYYLILGMARPQNK